MTNLETYIRQFAHLRRAPTAVFTAATKRQAPHKPFLLLAVLDLVARGVITSPFIAVTGANSHGTLLSIFLLRHNYLQQWT